MHSVLSDFYPPILRRGGIYCKIHKREKNTMGFVNILIHTGNKNNEEGTQFGKKASYYIFSVS